MFKKTRSTPIENPQACDYDPITTTMIRAGMAETAETEKDIKNTVIQDIVIKEGHKLNDEERRLAYIGCDAIAELIPEVVDRIFKTYAPELEEQQNLMILLKIK